MLCVTLESDISSLDSHLSNKIQQTNNTSNSLYH